MVSDAQIIISLAEYENLKKIEQAIENGGEFVITSAGSHVRIFNKTEATNELVMAISRLQWELDNERKKKKPIFNLF